MRFQQRCYTTEMSELANMALYPGHAAVHPYPGPISPLVSVVEGNTIIKATSYQSLPT